MRRAGVLMAISSLPSKYGTVRTSLFRPLREIKLLREAFKKLHWYETLKAGGRARMNYPSTLGDNWQWRMKDGAFTPSLIKRLLEMTTLYGRLSDAKKKEHN